MVTTWACQLAAWILPGKETRTGGPHQASHDMEAGTSWYEIVDGLSRPHQCILVGQVGGELQRDCWDRAVFLDTGWRPRRSRAWMGISRSKLVKED